MSVRSERGEIRSLFDMTGKRRSSPASGGSAARPQGLAAYGANVVITSRRAENLRGDRRSHQRGDGSHGSAVSCDCVDQESVEVIVQRPWTPSVRRHPRHAPAGQPLPPPRSSHRRVGEVMDSSSRGPTCAARPRQRMIAQGSGKIVTVGRARRFGHPGGYSATAPPRRRCTCSRSSSPPSGQVTTSTSNSIARASSGRRSRSRSSRPRAQGDLPVAHPWARGRPAGLHGRRALPVVGRIGLRDGRHPAVDGGTTAG